MNDLRNDVDSSEARWRKALLPIGSTLQQAISNLTESGLQIVLVVTPEGSLAGSITDGDIRRERRALGLVAEVLLPAESARRTSHGCGRQADVVGVHADGLGGYLDLAPIDIRKAEVVGH